MRARVHMCLDVRGALAWPKKRLAQMFTDERGKYATADEARKCLLDHIAHGHRVIPMGACEGFSYETGCPGHAIADEAAGALDGGGEEKP